MSTLVLSGLMGFFFVALIALSVQRTRGLTSADDER